MPPPHGERGDGAHRVVRDVRALGRERVLEVDELEADGLEQRARRLNRQLVRRARERAHIAHNPMGAVSALAVWRRAVDTEDGR